MFCTIPCDSELPSEASDWLKAQYEARKIIAQELACKCQNRATLPAAAVPFLKVPSFWAQGKWPWLFMLVPLEQMVGSAARENWKLEA